MTSATTPDPPAPDPGYLPRWHPQTLRAAAWAWRACRAARVGYARPGWQRVDLPEVPAGLPDGAVYGVRGVLYRRGERCLVRSAVLQAWEAAHGRDHDLVIGVTAPSAVGGFKAHAWLDDEHAHTCATNAEFTEIVRREPASA